MYHVVGSTSHPASCGVGTTQRRAELPDLVERPEAMSTIETWAKFCVSWASHLASGV